MHEVLVNRVGGLSLPMKSVVRLTDRPDMTIDVYRGRKTAMQQQHSLQFTMQNRGTCCFNKCFNTEKSNGIFVRENLKKQHRLSKCAQL